MEVAENYGDDVQIIGVPSLAEVDSMQAFVDDQGVASITHIPDAEGALWDHFGVENHRTYVLVNDDGTATRAAYGELDQAVADLIAR